MLPHPNKQTNHLQCVNLENTLVVPNATLTVAPMDLRWPKETKNTIERKKQANAKPKD